ncbi:MAG: hypothetical protein AB1465_02765 [Patescibacteria group bacterium]
MLLKTNYKSGWHIVVLPTLLFIIIFWGISVYFGWRFQSGLVFFISLIFCLVLAFVVSILSYRFFLRLAAKGRGEMQLENNILKWRIGRKEKMIDLSKEYEAEFFADSSHSLIDIEPADLKCEITIHCRDFTREEFLKFFPHPYFVDKIALTPELGRFGFDLEAANPESKKFFVSLISLLWKNKEKNKIFLIYKKFPWESVPAPKIDYIKIIDWKNKTLEEEKLISEINKKIISQPTLELGLTPDYLVGCKMKGILKDITDAAIFKQNDIVEKYFIMPLGKIWAEKLLPRPDFKKFFAGKAIIALIATSFGRAIPAGGPYLEDKHYLKINGYDKNKKQASLVFEWFGPEDIVGTWREKYQEAEILFKFINREIKIYDKSTNR